LVRLRLNYQLKALLLKTAQFTKFNILINILYINKYFIY
jgi:hypothetical protein